MKRFPSRSFATATVALLFATSASAADNRVVGNWALASLGGGGSVVPLDSACLADRPATSHA